MKIRSIRLENLGPFYNLHELELDVDEEAPVVLIHGENMRGKTSLMNAIKWCLYGRAFDRRGRPIPTYRLINYDAMDERDFHMTVTLDYEHEGHRFLLERQVQATHRPSSDNDLRTNLSLRRDGHFVATEEIPEIVGDMLHEDIARFFLFDGEMLGHFEVLLSEPGREASLVKESIEQILGLPALQRMGEDLEELRKDAEKRQLRAARAAKKNEKLVAEAQQVANEIEAIGEDLRRLRSQLEKVRKEQDSYRQLLDEFSEIQADVRQIEQIEQAILDNEQERCKLIGECRRIIASAWWMPVTSRANDLLIQYTEQASAETAQVTHTEILRDEIASLEKALSNENCPICEQALSSDARSTIEVRLSDARAELETLSADINELQEALSNIKQLRPFAEQEALARLHEKEIQVRRLSLDIHRNERNLKTIRKRLRGHDVKAIRVTEEKNERCIIQIKEISDAIEEKGKRQTQLENDLSRLSREIQRLPGADPRTAAETTVYGTLEKIFEGAVEQFRDALRQDVEREATDIFRTLTTEAAYERLGINEQYGLLIVDADGRDIRDRSAGAEQVVALSLVGALNRCAVREGPVVMDTPFGRLDISHRQNILEFVPTMSSQVILLVQSGEFNRARDLVYLANRVGREYRLVRNGAPTRSRFESVASVK